MKLDDLQPLDKVLVCATALATPEAMTCVYHADAGELDFQTDEGYIAGNGRRMCAAFLEVEFPHLRGLGDVPPGTVAVHDEDGWHLEPINYSDQEGPGQMPPLPPPDKRLSGWSYTCACCGEAKTGLPELSFKAPGQAVTARTDPDYEVLEQTSDLCRIRIEGQEYFFIRGLVPIALPEARDTYCFGAWTSISPANFPRYRDSMDGEQRDLGVMFGYLSNALPGMPDTSGLQVNIVPGAPGLRPYLLLRAPDEPHPLFEAQQQGINAAQLMEWIGPELRCEGSA